ncbi:30S ribosomal protein S18 [Candidatus Kuenenbacteria bacterium CG_4_9_14_3_um_filter_39_14]|uniref:Small ribosomal subunit protein bS18 n=6 Tax=Candidatus Kueneniibacteriota TaxID=1752740 RepID=A0A2M7ILR6_9BACT|nr:MAG: 30S ribosomal protein S18 [Candidatus Kuenenbacteria bacterium CG23_combo_of_CG06-09_8_20_14_all_39_39]PIP76094.1 MAG: 30S ribosomal protein S18 [Candidatus Kuenenbacteria bacterium CG22_combo_CG10-13_8_21_14_all_39_9]PIR80476.1 MAG: 30S ribosomal protein S18 [Candidatus Kuenenbacteria bacterium CG10_big_fil_rev_8_21_14_0_10_39_14]PIW95720.1 MAG: 30S ribosomal protein S18 [Candidatus Kuenenbacteria bacterium CG_4_8_14_3_um_filter_39_15]PIX92419.1 MAG: 30S ribosomal protein S18 [Candidat
MNQTTADKHCHFCVNQLDKVDWKDIPTLQRFMSHYNRIVPGRRTGLCAKHQRKVARAIKRAREMGLMPFVRK